MFIFQTAANTVFLFSSFIFLTCVYPSCSVFRLPSPQFGCIHLPERSINKFECCVKLFCSKQQLFGLCASMPRVLGTSSGYKTLHDNVLQECNKMLDDNPLGDKGPVCGPRGGFAGRFGADLIGLWTVGPLAPLSETI